ncbi:MAG: hypothetical protein V7756_10735 [Halopseudomonas sp.]|uniref:hypothetical protein n=1 Tax=Halopseudomonas sp. TaxID=2901191 RepID=UPI0030011841
MWIRTVALTLLLAAVVLITLSATPAGLILVAIGAGLCLHATLAGKPRGAYWLSVGAVLSTAPLMVFIGVLLGMSGFLATVKH